MPGKIKLSGETTSTHFIQFYVKMELKCGMEKEFCMINAHCFKLININLLLIALRRKERENEEKKESAKKLKEDQETKASFARSEKRADRYLQYYMCLLYLIKFSWRT